MPMVTLADDEAPETLSAEPEPGGNALDEESRSNTSPGTLIPGFASLIQRILKIKDKKFHLECSVRAEELLRLIDSERSYNLRQIAARVLGLESSDESSPSGVGREIRHDLQLLIGQISASTATPVEVATERVLTSDEVAQRWNVSAKTISRWRERGLIARTFIFNGRERVGFLESSLNRFAAAYPKIVKRGSRFSRMTEEEQTMIVRRAHEMLASGIQISAVRKQLEEETGRSLECIRVLLKNEKVTPGQNGAKSKATITRITNQKRIKRIFDLPLDYMSSAEFNEANADERILAPTPTAPNGQRLPRRPSDLPAYIASLYDVPLLTSEQETHLFRKYNYLKYKAANSRENLGRTRTRVRLMDEIESLYREAMETKNHLIRANMRLVVAVAKKYIGSTDDLFDKVSEGNLSLMRAVEKFDYTRGFKFSTYATWAIKKNYIRAYSNEIKQSDRFRSGHEEVLESEHDRRTNETTALVAQLRREDQVNGIMQRLTDRERRIISSRFGIGTGREPMTLKEVGEELGVTKERVRQIETRAMQKLRDAMRENDEINFEDDDELPEQSDLAATEELRDWKIEGQIASSPKQFSEQGENEGKKRELLFAQDAAISLRVSEADLPQYLNTYVFNGQHYFTLEEIEVFLQNRHKREAKNNGTTPKIFTLINKRSAVRMLGRKKYNDREPQLTNYHLIFKRGTERDLFCLEEVNTY